MATGTVNKRVLDEFTGVFADTGFSEDADTGLTDTGLTDTGLTNTGLTDTGFSEDADTVLVFEDAEADFSEEDGFTENIVAGSVLYIPGEKRDAEPELIFAVLLVDICI